jgi:hypothetical protein
MKIDPRQIANLIAEDPNAHGFELVPGVPDNQVINYVYEYWGKSGVSDSLMVSLNETGARLTPMSMMNDVVAAIKQNPETAQMAIQPFRDEIAEMFSEMLSDDPGLAGEYGR